MFAPIFSVLIIACQSGTVIDRLKSDINYLCSPELKGRNVPGETGDITAQWIENQFKEIGLKPVGEGKQSGYRFELPIVEARLDTVDTYFSINGVKFGWGDGYHLFPKKVSDVNVDLSAVWCEDGDYSAAQGRAAVINATARPAAFAAAAAKRAGVAALVVVYADSSKEVDRKLKEIRESGFNFVELPNSEPEFPVVYLDSGSLNLSSGINLHLSLQFTDYNQAVGYNVVGKIDGSVDEYVVIAAHYDHLGEDGAGSYYPGADDNASGVAGMLELCRLWSEREPDGRGLIAMSFTAEEDGMLGSKWLMGHLPFPREKISAAVNMDMIGRNGFSSYRDVHDPAAVIDTNYVGVFHSAQSPELEELINSANSGISLTVDMKGINSFPFSDAGSFQDVQLPTVHLFSGYHADYSSVGDTPDKLNYFKISRIVNLIDAILLELRSSDVKFDPNIRAKSAGMNY